MAVPSVSLGLGASGIHFRIATCLATLGRLPSDSGVASHNASGIRDSWLSHASVDCVPLPIVGHACSARSKGKLGARANSDTGVWGATMFRLLPLHIAWRAPSWHWGCLRLSALAQAGACDRQNRVMGRCARASVWVASLCCMCRRSQKAAAVLAVVLVLASLSRWWRGCATYGLLASNASTVQGMRPCVTIDCAPPLGKRRLAGESVACVGEPKRQCALDLAPFLSVHVGYKRPSCVTRASVGRSPHRCVDRFLCTWSRCVGASAVR